MYGYLQKGQDDQAKKQLDYLYTIHEVSPINFKVLYAFAAIPARYYLEKRMWNEAANLEFYPADFPWEKFSWQKAIVHFARVMGNVHLSKIAEAKKELDTLRILHDALSKEINKSKEAAGVIVQIKHPKHGYNIKKATLIKAVALMTEAADMEDGTEKHPVTPGEVIPARELLGEMFLEMNKPELALEAFQLDLKTHPNRFNALYDAGAAAKKIGNREKAND
jgi:tetratricopeptide (TPR) repeat protein